MRVVGLWEIVDKGSPYFKNKPVISVTGIRLTYIVKGGGFTGMDVSSLKGNLSPSEISKVDGFSEQAGSAQS